MSKRPKYANMQGKKGRLTFEKFCRRPVVLYGCPLYIEPNSNSNKNPVETRGVAIKHILQ